MEHSEEKEPYSRIDTFFIGWFLGMAAMLIVCLVSTNGIEEQAYKQGQIDCQNGEIKYRLIEHPNKTTTWEKIK